MIMPNHTLRLPGLCLCVLFFFLVTACDATDPAASTSPDPSVSPTPTPSSTASTNPTPSPTPTASESPALDLAGQVSTLAGSTMLISGQLINDGNFLFIAREYGHKILKADMKTGVITVLAGTETSGYADGTGPEAVFSYPAGIASDGTNLYISESGNNCIRKVVIATGEVSTFAGARTAGNADGTGTAAYFNNPKGLAIDDTTLYVADMGNHRIRAVNLSTAEVRTIAGSTRGSTDGTGTAASFNNPMCLLLVDSQLLVSDWSNQKIRSINLSSNDVSTLAGSGEIGNTDGSLEAASFYNPQGLAWDGTYVYVADSNNDVIRKINQAAGTVETFVGGSIETGIADSQGLSANLSAPNGITCDGTNLYITESIDTIRKISLDDATVTMICPSFNNPHSITSDGTNLYVTDQNNHRVQKIDMVSMELSTLAGLNSQPGFSEGTGHAARFKYPQGIVRVGNNLFVADSGNYRIRKIDIPTGEVTTLAGSGDDGYVDGEGSVATFTGIKGIATDGTSLFVADGNRIRQVDIATGTVSTLAGGSSNSDSANGTGTEAGFSTPRGIACDNTNLYVTESNRIRKIVIATAEVSTLSGSTSSGHVDGDASTARFFVPTGICTDGVNVYVGDGSGKNNRTIRKVVIATGEVSTLAGSSTSGDADGTGTAASFRSGNSITILGGKLYVVDSSNDKIRCIQ